MAASIAHGCVHTLRDPVEELFPTGERSEFLTRMHSRVESKTLANRRLAALC